MMPGGKVMSDFAFNQVSQSVELLSIFQLELLKEKIENLLAISKSKKEKTAESDLELFEHFSGLGEGIDAENAKLKYFEEKYGSSN